MGEQKHTKGPWAWQKFGKVWCLVGDYGMRPFIIGRVNKELATRHETHDIMVPFDPNHPDAKLIASAPQLAEDNARLREVLRRVVHGYFKPCTQDFGLQALRDAKSLDDELTAREATKEVAGE